MLTLKKIDGRFTKRGYSLQHNDAAKLAITQKHRPCIINGTSIHLKGVDDAKREVLPGIEPGLPEDTEVIRIRSDNRYLEGLSYLIGLI